MLYSYLKIALRNLWRSSMYSLLNIGGLAMGIACCLLIALYVYDEWTFDRFHRHADTIYRVVEKQPQAGEIYDVAVTPGPLAPTIKADFPEVVQVGRIGKWSGLMKYGKQVFEEGNLFFADNGLLQMFDFPLIRGNGATALTRPDELLLTESTARKYFGTNWQQNPKVIGATLRLNNERDYQVVGVLQDIPANSHLQFDMLLSFKNVELFDKWGYAWGSNNYHTYVQVTPSTDPASFGQKIKGQYMRYGKTETTLALQPLIDIHLYSNFAFNTDWGKHSDIFYVKLFSTVGLIVLLIACVNFINLSTARSTRRAKEVGVRKTIGANRQHLIFQFLGESFLLTGLAILVALLFANALMPVFNQLSGKNLTLDFTAFPFWSVLMGLTLFVGLLSGLYPAFLLSSFQPTSVLKGVFGNAKHTYRQAFRQALVVGQFTFSIALIICTAFIYNQLQYMQRKNLGFDKSQLLYVGMGGALRGKVIDFKKELLRQSAIEAAAATTATLVDVGNSSNINWEGQQPKDEFLITQMNVDPDFLSTVGMKLERGANFREKSAKDTSATYLINETAARRMGYTAESAIGKRVEFWGTKGRIAGVVRDFHFRPLNVAIEPFIFRYAPDNPYFQMLVKTRAGQAQQAIQAISRLYKQYEKEAPLQYGFVDQELDKQYRREQRTGQIVLYFSGLAILISCLGLFGLAAFTAEQRTKEIGVRKVLGASVSSIVGLLSKDFVKLVIIAIAIASPLAWYATHRWLQAFAYKVDISWWVFAATGCLAVGIAVLTIGFQSLKAAMANPVKSLRTE
ncbi:ABC transporter permease [Spirosoma knui]